MLKPLTMLTTSLKRVAQLELTGPSVSVFAPGGAQILKSDEQLCRSKRAPEQSADNKAATLTSIVRCILTPDVFKQSGLVRQQRGVDSEGYADDASERRSEIYTVKTVVSIKLTADVALSFVLDT